MDVPELLRRAAEQYFDGVQSDTVAFWDLLVRAAQQMSLAGDAAWCEWRRAETLHGIMRADLQLVAPDDGGRSTPIPGAGQLRPMWPSATAALRMVLICTSPGSGLSPPLKSARKDEVPSGSHRPGIVIREDDSPVDVGRFGKH